MISVVVEYENFLGEKRTKELWFHMSTNDLADVNLKDNDSRGLIGVIERLSAVKDYKGIKDNFDMLVNMAYGIRSADGEYFDKDPKETSRFKNSAAYEALFNRFLEDAEFAAEFVNGIMPEHKQTNTKLDVSKALGVDVQKYMKQAPVPKEATGYMGSVPVQQPQTVPDFRPHPVDNYGSYK